MKYTAKTGKRIDTVPKSVLDSLGAYAWPGNVRELANVLERSVIISRGNSLELGEWAAVPVESGAVTTGHRRLTISLASGSSKPWSGPGGGSAVPAALPMLLGLKPTTLEARMKRLGITRPSTTSQSS